MHVESSRAWVFGPFTHRFRRLAFPLIPGEINDRTQPPFFFCFTLFIFSLFENPSQARLSFVFTSGRCCGSRHSAEHIYTLLVLVISFSRSVCCYSIMHPLEAHTARYHISFTWCCQIRPKGALSRMDRHSVIAETKLETSKNGRKKNVNIHSVLRGFQRNKKRKKRAEKQSWDFPLFHLSLRLSIG